MGNGGTRVVPHGVPDEYTMYRGIYEHENDLFSNGIGFFVAGQAFLIGAFYTLLTASFCGPQSLGHHICHRNVTWISWIGIGLSVVTFLRLVPPIFAEVMLWCKKRKCILPHWGDWYDPQHRLTAIGAAFGYVIFYMPSLAIPGAFIAFWVQAKSFD